MARNKKKKIVHEDVLECWHLDNHIPGSREWKLIMCLAREEEFNDPYTTVVVTDDSRLQCESIGY